MQTQRRSLGLRTLLPISRTYSITKQRWRPVRLRLLECNQSDCDQQPSMTALNCLTYSLCVLGFAPMTRKRYRR